MDMLLIIILAALVSILANSLNVWEFVSSRLAPILKKPKNTRAEEPPRGRARPS